MMNVLHGRSPDDMLRNAKLAEPLSMHPTMDPTTLWKVGPFHTAMRQGQDDLRKEVAKKKQSSAI